MMTISRGVFVHPIIKGVIIHFLIAFIHPFVDGNGRTARAVFYWYMLRRGYWLTEYLSISLIIGRSKRKYEKAYLYTECDDNDLGYFIAYHLHAISQAYGALRKYIQRKIDERQQTSDIFRLGNINARQAQIIKWYNDTPDISFSVKGNSGAYECVISDGKGRSRQIGRFGICRCHCSQ